MIISYFLKNYKFINLCSCFIRVGIAKADQKWWILGQYGLVGVGIISLCIIIQYIKDIEQVFLCCVWVFAGVVGFIVYVELDVVKEKGVYSSSIMSGYKLRTVSYFSPQVQVLVQILDLYYLNHQHLCACQRLRTQINLWDDEQCCFKIQG